MLKKPAILENYPHNTSFFLGAIFINSKKQQFFAQNACVRILEFPIHL